jgi:hypothetical protein
VVLPRTEHLGKSRECEQTISEPGLAPLLSTEKASEAGEKESALQEMPRAPVFP